MARRNSKKVETSENNSNLMQNKIIKRSINSINNMLGQINLNMYGTDRNSSVDLLDKQFNELLKTEIDGIGKPHEDVTSFLGKLVSNDRKQNASDQLLTSQFMSMTSDEFSTMQSLIYDAYRNKFIEQSDLHEVSSQLIELSEAILITRDAIISADVVEGRMSRTIKFNNIDTNDIDDTTPIIENMEKKFKLQEKIKNFIIPKTLEYGEYYVYIIPYAKIFNDFVQSQNSTDYRSNELYKEKTLLESTNEYDKKKRESSKKNGKKTKDFIKELYESYTNDDSKMKRESVNEKEFTEDMTNILSNIVISNEEIPIPLLEEGLASMNEFKEQFMNESCTKAFTEAKSLSSGKKNNNKRNLFKNISNSSDGTTITNDPDAKEKYGEFADINDCYVKLLQPTKVLPIDIMGKVVGYYYVQEEEITALGGVVSSTLYYNKFDGDRRQRTIIDSIAERIVDSFDKDFLKDNIKFKEVIAEALNYYNLNEKKIKFQFIPVEYIQEFKIDEDENGRGQSMIKKSLFYAKLYLMLLLFKIMSIILYSNDQKVNYIRQSGIDKNVSNKVQEIARMKQSRQINMTDLFSYTTLINKIGSGMELYIPTGRQNERPIETEILSGQEIQLNTELLEMLKNAYILGTGVPAAIVNYLNEADFAKQIEQNNTKFNGRVVNYQLDFNSSITEMYKKIARWSTNIPSNIIDNMEVNLQPPKSTIINTKSEEISSNETILNTLVSLFFGNENDDGTMAPTRKMREIQKFKLLFMNDNLPMLNLDRISELVDRARLEVEKEILKPSSSNGDNGDDDGMSDEELGL